MSVAYLMALKHLGLRDGRPDCVGCRAPNGVTTQPYSMALPAPLGSAAGALGSAAGALGSAAGALGSAETELLRVALKHSGLGADDAPVTKTSHKTALIITGIVLGTLALGTTVVLVTRARRRR